MTRMITYFIFTAYRLKFLIKVQMKKNLNVECFVVGKKHGSSSKFMKCKTFE